jgi:EmrB/QacA subfamily drug resistance transporter
VTASGANALTSTTIVVGGDAPIQEQDRAAAQNSSGAAADEFCATGRSLFETVQKDTPMTMDNRTRWLALLVLCLGDLMIVLDTTIVNVALPSIRVDLGFSETSLAWVVNAYLLTFGGFLLLGGRLGDLFGHRRLFLLGVSLFTVASVACGLSTTQGLLVAARAVQGLGGAVVSAVALSLIMNMFMEPAERAKAMGIFGFVLSGGGTIGVLLGGVLTDAFSWHWIFLVNVPIGIAVYLLSLRLVPASGGSAAAGRLDVAGAVTVTASLMLAVYAIVNGNQEGWTSGQTLGLLGGAAALMAIFLAIEARVSSPLVPLGLFRLRNVATANVVGVLWAAAMFAWFFISALYLQQVLGYSPLKVGLAFLPATLIMGAFSISFSARLVMRFGIKTPLTTGLLLAAVGLVLFVRAPVDGNFFVDVLPSMILLGCGAGMAFNPVLLAAMSDVAPEESGLASGVVNTSFMMGGALGLAILATLAASRTDSLRTSGHGSLDALTGGYHVAFLVGGLFAAAAAALSAGLFRTATVQAGEPEQLSEAA